jgi:quercetin dioxygenase-like cupin family protein
VKSFKIRSVVSVVVLWSGVALAQDPVKVDPAHYKVLFENASVRVLSITYAAGATNKMHQHPDSIVIPLSNAKVRDRLRRTN